MDKREYAKNLLEKGESHRKTLDKVKEKFGESFSLRTIGEIAKEITDTPTEGIDQKTRKTVVEWQNAVNTTINELNEDIENITKYTFADDHYIFYKNVKHPNTGEKIKKEYKLPLAYVDSIFKDYSRHGGDLSQQQIFDKYNLKPEVWNMLKSRLGLYKDSHVLSPMSLERADEKGEADEVIYKAAYTAITDKHKQKFIKTCDAILIDEGKKAIKALSSWQNFFDAMKHNINYREPIKPTKVPKVKQNSDILHLFLSDIHNGKTEKLDGVAIKDRLYWALQYAINHPATTIDGAFLWDMTETSMPWGYHLGQIEGMRGVYGFDLIMDTVNLLERFLYELYMSGKKITRHMQGGNHDKITSNSDHDRQRTIALIIYEMVRRGLSQCKMDLEIIKDTVGYWESDDFNVISIHGDQGMDKIDPEKMAWKYANKNGKHVLFVSGDKHQTGMKDGRGTTHIKVPAIAGENHYDKDNAYHGDPGYVAVTKNEYNKPDILFRKVQ